MRLTLAFGKLVTFPEPLATIATARCGVKTLDRPHSSRYRSDAVRIHAVSHIAALEGVHLADWSAVVIDVLRASSTISQAIASGAEGVFPVPTVEAAFAAKQAGRTTAPLLGGEREGLPPSGFDLGNSPGDYTSEVVGGRRIIFTTTNGTRAIAATKSARGTVIGALLNLPAVVDYLLDQGDDILLVAVGRGGRPVLDDTVTAGMYVERLAEAVPAIELTAEAEEARSVYAPYRGRVLEAFRASDSGKALTAIGLGADLERCATVGVLDAVPRQRYGVITA
jgi:2-phosphosulfolactate phosphatase